MTNCFQGKQGWSYIPDVPTGRVQVHCHCSPNFSNTHIFYFFIFRRNRDLIVEDFKVKFVVVTFFFSQRKIGFKVFVTSQVSAHSFAFRGVTWCWRQQQIESNQRKGTILTPQVSPSRILRDFFGIVAAKYVWICMAASSICEVVVLFYFGYFVYKTFSDCTILDLLLDKKQWYNYQL